MDINKQSAGLAMALFIFHAPVVCAQQLTWTSVAKQQ